MKPDGTELPILKRLAQLSKQPSHSIHKVQGRLRDVNNKAYEPELVAIGPYHHGNDKLKEMEEVKLCYFERLLCRKPEVPADFYFSVIERIAEKARDCYAEFIDLDAYGFIEMLVLDGCFIIELVGPERKIHNGRIFQSLEYDLVLMENQIPFFVLCELFDIIEGPEQHALLMRRILLLCKYLFPGGILYSATSMRRSEEVKHILDLFHSNWYPPCTADQLISIATATQAVYESQDSNSVCLLIIPSAEQLKDANVEFKKREYDREPFSFHETRGTTVFDVVFKKGGVMLMPTLKIYDGTESMLRNLIAFEQYLPPGEPTRIIDYALLLDLLINSQIDVQILCRCGIIENNLGSDMAVVDFVNKLTDKINIHNFQYAEIFDRLNKHHKMPWNRAVAVLRRDYFSSPWAFLSVSAAVVLLLLTIAQTFFAARSS